MASGLNSNEYEDRLTELGMETLEESRHQADKCMTRNIMHIRGKLDPNTWFDKPQTTRGLRSAADPLNVKKRHGKMEIRTNFFSICKSSLPMEPCTNRGEGTGDHWDVQRELQTTEKAIVNPSREYMSHKIPY